MMAKITAEQLEVGAAWKEFGNRLDWMFVAALDDGATFFIKHDGDQGTVRKITFAMRFDIERTWREQDKPAVKVVSNG